MASRKLARFELLTTRKIFSSSLLLNLGKELQWDKGENCVTKQNKAIYVISMPQWKIAVTPLLTHWSYCRFPWSHRYMDGWRNDWHAVSVVWTECPCVTEEPISQACALPFRNMFSPCLNPTWPRAFFPLQWRHNEHPGVSNHRRLDSV